MNVLEGHPRWSRDRGLPAAQIIPFQIGEYSIAHSLSFLNPVPLLTLPKAWVRFQTLNPSSRTSRSEWSHHSFLIIGLVLSRQACRCTALSTMHRNDADAIEATYRIVANSSGERFGRRVMTQAQRDLPREYVSSCVGEEDGYAVTRSTSWMQWLAQVLSR